MSFIEISGVLGNLGEFIGAFGVMASLIYVGLQIKQTRNVVRAESQASFSQTGMGIYLFIAGNRDIAEMLGKDFGRDTDEQMLSAFWTASFFRLEDTFIKHEFNLIGHGIRSLEGQIQSLARSPVAMTAWQEHKDRFNEEFVDFVDMAVSRVSS